MQQVVLLYNPEYEVRPISPEDWTKLVSLFPDGAPRLVAEEFHRRNNQPIGFSWMRTMTPWFPLVSSLQ